METRDKAVTEYELLEFWYLSDDSDSEYQSSDSDEDDFEDIDEDSDYEGIEEILDLPVTDVDIQPNVSTDEKPNWKDVPHARVKNLLFSAHTGLFAQPIVNTPIAYFDMLVDKNFYKIIVENTNIYAEKLFLKADHDQSRIAEWQYLNIDDIRTFFGLLLHMGTIQINRIENYWKKHPLFNLHCFSDHMSRNKFLLILRALHFAKNTAVEEADVEDELFKVSPIVDYFNKKMHEVYSPGKNVCFSESTVLWRDRMSFRQYIRNKRCECGFKLYSLTDSNGITVKIMVCRRGKNERADDKQHTSTIVLNLMSERLRKGHCIYMDESFSNYHLSRELLSYATYCTGLLNPKRKGNCEEVVTAKLKNSEILTKYSDGVMMGKWQNQLFISTEFMGKMVTSTNKRGIQRKKPDVIMEYTKQMSLINRKDKNLANNSCDRQSLRWYKKIGIHILQLLLLNSYYMYKNYSVGSKMTFYDYRLEVISNLLSLKPNMRDERSLAGVHLPSLLPRSGTKIARKECRICTRSKKRKMTNYCCRQCDGMPGLCLETCFKRWHSE